MKNILQFVQQKGECLDTEIAKATGMTLFDVHRELEQLKASKKIMLCESTKFVKGKEIKAIVCRISGYIPPAKPGAKPKVQITLS